MISIKNETEYMIKYDALKKKINQEIMQYYNDNWHEIRNELSC